MAGASALLGVGFKLFEFSQQKKRAKKIDKLNQQKANLEKSRSIRKQIRASQFARARALAVATGQGASYPGSSGLPGVQGSIAATTAGNIQTIEAGARIGSQLTAASRPSTGEQLASLGGALVSGFGKEIDQGAKNLGFNGFSFNG